LLFFARFVDFLNAFLDGFLECLRFDGDLTCFLDSVVDAFLVDFLDDFCFCFEPPDSFFVNINGNLFGVFINIT
jgi:hypothetical protein